MCGVPMYSAFCPMESTDAKSAEWKAAKKYRIALPLKAIEWPPTSQASKNWLAKYVGDRHTA